MEPTHRSTKAPRHHRAARNGVEARIGEIGWHDLTYRNSGPLTNLTVLVDLVDLLDAVSAAARAQARAARADGFTWTEIGQALGISRQAAQQRFRETP